MTELAELAGRVDEMVEGTWTAVSSAGQSVREAERQLCEAEGCLRAMEEWSHKVRRL